MGGFNTGNVSTTSSLLEEILATRFI